MDISGCKDFLLPQLNLPSTDLFSLYKVPTTHSVPLQSIESTLGTLSVLELEEELPLSQTVGETFEQNPLQGHLHLVLVDRGTPLPVKFWIPSTQKYLSVQVTDQQIISHFRPEIEAQDPTLKGRDLLFYKTPFSHEKPQELRWDLPKDQLIDPLSNLYKVFDDVPFSKSPCITVEAVLPPRKHALSVQNTDECRKRQALTDRVAPSKVDVAHLRSVQSHYDQRIYDYRMPSGCTGPLPECDLPPIEVLFDGFGQFLEIWRAASATNFSPDPDPLDPPDQDPLYILIDNFVAAMSRAYPDESARLDAVRHTLNKIFPSTEFRHSILPIEIPRTVTLSTGSPPRRDGLARYGDTIPCILLECKNEAITSCIPIGELVAYYKLLVDDLCSTRSAVVNASRLPTLGITIIGNSITFYALAFVRSIVCLPLTTSLWCLPIESGGSDRYQLYAAFKAAIVFLKSIDDEAKRILDGPGDPAPINRPILPQFTNLRRYHNPNFPTTGNASPSDEHVEFQFEEFLAKDFNRHVYKASSSIGPLVIKLTRSYSPDLHAFCAHLGRAPKLYAYEERKGGIIAVAMEYVEGQMLTPSSDPVLQLKWTTAMTNLVKMMHAEDFVHGDLREPNFVIVKDEVMLLDFDWGGKVGEARYPPVRLLDVLSKGRATRSLDITKQDDERILNDTIKFVRGGDALMAQR